MEVISDFIQLLSDHFVAITFLVIIYLFRTPISSFLPRIKRFSFKHGDTSGELETNELIEKTSVDKLDRVNSEQEEDEDEEKDEEEKVRLKNGSWHAELIQLLENKEFGEAEKLFNTVQEGESDSSNRASNQAFYYYYQYKNTHDPYCIVQLRNFIYSLDDQAQINRAAFWLEIHYRHSNQYEQLIDFMNHCLSKTDFSPAITDYTCTLAYSLIQLERYEEAYKTLNSRLQKANDDDERFQLYSQLYDYFETLQDYKLAALAKEKLAEIKPDDPDELFSAAYRQSKSDLNPLVINNYEVVLSLDPNSYALNNLGVEANSLEFKGTAIDYYSKAAAKKNTLSMANLAHEYMNAGFYEAAEAILEEAISLDDVHSNVWEAKSKLDKMRQKEVEDWSRYLSQTKKLSSKIREVASYALDYDLDIQLFAGTWFTTQGYKVSVNIDGSRLKAQWTEERRTALGRALTENKNEYQVSLSGRVFGKACFLTFTKALVNDSGVRSILGTDSQEKSLVGAIYGDLKLSLFSQDPTDNFVLVLSRDNPEQ